MEAILTKWGNSLGIRIPRTIAKDLNLEDGSHVIIEENENRIIIYPGKQELDTLLSLITSENLHSEISTDSSVGNEIW